MKDPGNQALSKLKAFQEEYKGPGTTFLYTCHIKSVEKHNLESVSG